MSSTNDTQRTAEFFRKLGRDYIESAANDYEAIYSRTLATIEPYLYGKVLNIGSGGVDLPFSSKTDLTVSSDVAENLLQYHKLTDKNRAICAVSNQLPFRYASFDVAVAHFALHHFAQQSARSTIRYLLDCFDETRKVLEKGGKFIVAENVVSQMVASLEELVYPFGRDLLMRFNRPPVFLFSLQTLEKCFLSSGFKLVRVMTFKAASKALILPFSIPKTLNPMSIAILVGEKQ